MLNTVVVNFDNFCKIRLRFDGRHKTEATGALFIDSKVRDTIWLRNNCSDYIIKDQLAVASLGGTGEGWTAPGDTLQGVTPKEKILWANLQRIVEKRGRTGKKRCGVTRWRGVTPE